MIYINYNYMYLAVRVYIYIYIEDWTFYSIKVQSDCQTDDSS